MSSYEVEHKCEAMIRLLQPRRHPPPFYLYEFPRLGRRPAGLRATHEVVNSPPGKTGLNLAQLSVSWPHYGPCPYMGRRHYSVRATS